MSELRDRAKEFRDKNPSVFSDIENNTLDYMTRFATRESSEAVRAREKEIADELEAHFAEMMSSDGEWCENFIIKLRGNNNG